VETERRGDKTKLPTRQGCWRLSAYDVTDYASRETWEALGWGKPIGSQGQIEATEERTRELREAMEMTAEGLGIESDDGKFDTAMDSGMVATAMPAVNAIPHVCEATPGIRRAYELPLITARGLTYPTE